MIKYRGFETLEVLEGADRYNEWIAESILPYISSPVLEVGSGTGNISQHFLSRSPLYITDSDNGLVKKLKEKFKGKKGVFIEYLDITQIPQGKLRSYFATIFAVNVLEHIENDSKALKNMSSLLRKGGRLVLLVPANKGAFTNLDKVLGHYRRYEKDELTERLTGAGFSVEKISYFNFLGLLSWIIRDKFERKNFHLKPYQIAAFDMVVPILKRVEKYIRVPLGISLVAIARKKR